VKTDWCPEPGKLAGFDQYQGQFRDHYQITLRKSLKAISSGEFQRPCVADKYLMGAFQSASRKSSVVSTKESLAAQASPSRTRESGGESVPGSKDDQKNPGSAHRWGLFSSEEGLEIGQNAKKALCIPGFGN
jgi:hypothetical protein